MTETRWLYTPLSLEAKPAIGVFALICAKLVPQMVKECIEEREIRISDLVSKLNKQLGEGEIIVVVNGKIVDNYDTVITEKDEVVIVQAFLGGYLGGQTLSK